MPTITVNHHSIYYFSNGRVEPQPTVVLIHGAGGRSQGWPYQWQQTYGKRASRMRRWVSDYPVIIPDLPGHGQSEPPGFDNIEAYAQFVIDFTDALDLAHFVVVGHSMGGAIAQQIGLMRPAKLRGLVLLGSGAKMDVSDLILNGLQTDFEKTVRLISKFSWQRQATPAFVETSLSHLLSTEPQVVYEDFLACSQFDARKQLGKIEVPTLVVGGKHDKMMRLAASEEMTALIPTATLETVDAGHFMMFEKTAQTTQHIVTFLATIERAL